MIKSKSKTEKVCLCGRIITDPNNNTGLCPKCQKTAGDALVVGGLIGGGLVLKKIGPKLVKGVGNIIKTIKK